MRGYQDGSELEIDCEYWDGEDNRDCPSEEHINILDHYIQSIKTLDTPEDKKSITIMFDLEDEVPLIKIDWQEATWVECDAEIHF